MKKLSGEKILKEGDFHINYGKNMIPINIKKVEERYNAKYVGNFPLKTVSDNWSEEPAAIFYQENPPEIAKSNYFALFLTPYGEHLLITDGLTAVSGTFDAVVSDEKEVLYSRYRHDFRLSKDKTVAIDGGRDYTKTSFGVGEEPHIIKLKVVKDKLVIDQL